MILVTGCTGLVGSHLLLQLLNAGKPVMALKRENSSMELIRKVFEYYSANPDDLLKRIEWVNGDVTDIYSLYEAMDGIDNMYHTAAMVSFHKEDRNEMMKVNIIGTANVVNACLYKGVKKLCHVSSIASLGCTDNDELIDEETHWKSSEKSSAYSISKYGAEREVWRGTIEGLPAVIVNPAVIIGPGDWKKGSSQLFEKMWNGLKFYTNGVNGYVDVRDVAKAMTMLMENDIINSRFILSSENLGYLQFFTIMAEGFGMKAPYIKANAVAGQLAWRAEKLKSLITHQKPLITKETARTAFRRYFYSNEKIRKTLDFEFIPMKDSIKETCNIFMKDHR